MKKFFKIGCGSLIALFVLIIALGIIGANGDGDSNDKTPASNAEGGKSSKKDDTTKEVKKIGIGEELTVGKVTFKINSIEEVQKISAANGLMEYKPDAEGAVFLTINATVRNDGTDMIQTDSSFFKLIAENGANYSPSTIIVADDKYFTFEGINPGLSLTGNVVFEVPSGLKGLEVQVQTGFFGTETGLIKLN